MKITDMTVCQLAGALKKRELSSVEATRAYFDKIAESEEQVGAYLSTRQEAALKEAEKADALLAEGNGTFLTGIPGAIKDNICTKGTATTCASKMLEHFVPPYDATVMEKLKAQDFVMLGKTNMDEFAMGSSTENSYFKITHNPRDLSRVPGGSSGGSAAAVAADEAAFALGSDTGGSIRQPAAFCGVVGMKPTYGTVSRYGLVAFASSLDQIGPLTKDVADNAAILNAIAGYDRRDATSVNRIYGHFEEQMQMGVQGMKVALPKEYFGAGLSSEIADAVHAAARRFEQLGAEIVEVSMPSLDMALPAYYVISSAEASSNLARFDGVKYGFRAEGATSIDDLYKKTRSEGFGPEVKRRIMLGSFTLSAGYYDAYYKKALQVRTLIMEDFKRIHSTCDFVLSPVAPTVAYHIGEKTEDPLEMYLGDVYTVPINIAGVPSLSLPCGKDSAGMPIGVQLIGPAFGEQTLYRAGWALEQSLKGELAK